MATVVTAFLDRCIWTATSSGTGSFVLSAAVPGFQTMAAAGAVNATIYGYAAQSADLSQWEVGTGTWTTATSTLTRTVLFNSLGTTAAVNFIAAPQVMITAIADTLVGFDAGFNYVASGKLFISNSTSASSLALYNTVDNPVSPTNYERAVCDWTTTANVLTFGTAKGGTGSFRALNILGTQIDFTNVNITGGVTTPLVRMPAGGGINLAGAAIKWQPGAFADGASNIGLGPVTGGSTNPVLGIGNGTTGDASGWLNWGGETRVTADFSVTSSTALVNVTGLAVSVVTGRTYQFEAELYVTDAAAGGVQAAIAGTATATAIQYTGYAIADNAIKGKTNATALATAVASTVTTETSGIIVRITGIITVNAAGTLTVQMAQNTSNATATVAKRGSWFIVNDTP